VPVIPSPIQRLWRDITDPAHWAVLWRYIRSGDLQGLSTQLHWFYLRQKKHKDILQLDLSQIAPAPVVWPADQPLVSIIIPCFNYGHFVRDAVDSVLAQHFQDFEIILIDGGSTDGSDKIVAAITHPKIRTFLRNGRHLLGDNRNFGIAQARGKYICCVDADDKITPDFLMKLVFLLESTTLDVVGSAKAFFGKITRHYHGPSQPSLQHLQSGNPVMVSSVYAKNLWEEIGPFCDFGTGADYIFEDWEFWYRAALHDARFYMATGEGLFLHRVHGTSMSRNTTIKPRKAHADFICRRHAAITGKNSIARSTEAQRQVQRRADPLVNLIRQPRPGIYQKLLVTTEPVTRADPETLILSLASDSAPEVTYSLPRFIPVALHGDFIHFAQGYFALPLI
jgi:hypothetical protein